MPSRPSAAFFFQAEGGRRCRCVTGVQTCALPISQAALAGRCDRRAGTKGTRPCARLGYNGNLAGAAMKIWEMLGLSSIPTRFDERKTAAAGADRKSVVQGKNFVPRGAAGSAERTR